MRLLFSLTLISVSISCGSDEPVVPTPLQVVVSPADGSKNVSVLSTMTVTLNHSLTASPTPATASLTWARGFNEIIRSGIVISGILVASDKQVTFTPSAPLAAGMTYRFSIAGLVTAAGEVPAISVTFTTWADPIDRQISRSAADTISSYSVYSYDGSGAATGIATYSGAGSDGVWLNADDVQSYLGVYADLTSGHWTKHYNYNGSGSDSQWGTADDVLNYHQLRTFDAHGQNTLYDSYSSVGTDTVPFSGDESYSFRTQRLFDEQGLMTRYFFISGPGPDQEWFTGDDIANGYSVDEYDDAGHRTRTVGFGRGADNLWFTADDVIGGYTEYALLPDGRIQTETECGDPGPDATWFTADDTDLYPTTYEYDARGLLVETVWYDYADNIGGYTRYDYDAAGRLISQRRYGKGADDEFLTADDFATVEWSYTTP